MSDFQDAFGAYPDRVNDLDVRYNFSKPPIHGWAAKALLQRSHEAPSAETLRTLYNSLARWTQWWLSYRVLPGQMLPYYLHGNDSGWDNGTMFDAGVPIIAPDLAAFLVLQMDVLAELAERLGQAEEAKGWLERADALLDALLTKLWTGERFIAHLASGEVVASASLSYCLPILLGERLPKEVQATLIQTVQHFLTDFGLATEQPESGAYRSDGYWRGPIWAPSTYLIVCGLEAVGAAQLARAITERFCRLCARSGFAENFDALTGAGLRDRAYTWTASVFLLLAQRQGPPQP